MTISENNTTTIVVNNENNELANGLRLFFGNLDFRTSASELKEYLAPYNVLQVTIPKRRLRSKTTNKPFTRGIGYGFAQFGSEEDANKALSELADITWNERKLTVSLAKPNDIRKKENESLVNSQNDSGALNGNDIKRKSKRNRRKKPMSTEFGSSVTFSKAGGSIFETGDKPRIQIRRNRRPPLPLNEDSPSRDTAFIAGIPRCATVADIKEFFSEEKPISAKISQRKDKNREKVNRGFALVKFENQAIRDAVIEKYNEKEWDGRIIHVRVALDVLRIKSDEITQSNVKTAGFKAENQSKANESNGKLKADHKENPKEESDKFETIPDAELKT